MIYILIHYRYIYIYIYIYIINISQQNLAKFDEYIPLYAIINACLTLNRPMYYLFTCEYVKVCIV